MQHAAVIDLHTCTCSLVCCPRRRLDASFLVNDQAIDFSSSSTYLSSVKRQLEDETSTTFFKDNKSWYKRLHKALRKRFLISTTEQGRPLQERAHLMTIGGLRVLLSRLFDPNNIESLKTGLYNIFVEVSGQMFRRQRRQFCSIAMDWRRSPGLCAVQEAVTGALRLSPTGSTPVGVQTHFMQLPLSSQPIAIACSIAS